MPAQFCARSAVPIRLARSALPAVCRGGRVWLSHGLLLVGLRVVASSGACGRPPGPVRLVFGPRPEIPLRVVRGERSIVYGQVVSEGQAAVFFIEGRRCDLLNPSIGGRWRVSGCSDQAELRLLRRHCRGGAAARCVLRMFLADLVLEHLDPFVAAAHAGAALLDFFAVAWRLLNLTGCMMQRHAAVMPLHATAALMMPNDFNFACVVLDR